MDEISDSTVRCLADKDHLSLLLHAIELISSSLNIQEILDRLMDQVIEVIGARRGFILLRDGVDEAWQFRSARGIEKGALDEEVTRGSRGCGGHHRTGCSGS